MSSDFRESFEGEPSGFADPRAQQDSVTNGSGSFVVDLVPQNDPADVVLCFRAGNRLPMRSGNFLHPPEVNGVVYVILLVDVIRQN